MQRLAATVRRQDEACVGTRVPLDGDGREMALDGIVATAAGTLPVDAARIETLQQQRSELVEQYVKARPTGSDGWKLGTGIGVGTLAASAGIGAVLVANRGKGAMYQGFNLMVGLPMALAGGGGIGYVVGARLGEHATRPRGEAASRQVAATRNELARRISDIDQKLTAADGRRPQPLPAIPEPAKLSPGRVAGHAAAGLGLGILTTVPALAGVEKLIGGGVHGGPTYIATLAAPALAAGVISYLDQRDEAAGGEGSFLRAAGIGAAAVGASALVPALGPIPLHLRLLGGAAAGAVVGSAVHMASASSRD